MCIFHLRMMAINKDVLLADQYIIINGHEMLELYFLFESHQQDK